MWIRVGGTHAAASRLGVFQHFRGEVCLHCGSLGIRAAARAICTRLLGSARLTVLQSCTHTMKQLYKRVRQLEDRRSTPPHFPDWTCFF